MRLRRRIHFTLLLIAALALASAQIAGAAEKLELVSATPDGKPGDDDSAGAFVSGNGRYVAFISIAGNLEPRDKSSGQDVLVRDLKKGRTEIVSRNSKGKQANAVSSTPSLSVNGRYVAFLSSATNLTPKAERKKDLDVFVRDRKTGKTTLVSVGDNGRNLPGHAEKPMISADGSAVAFVSGSDQLVDGDGNRAADVFVRDLDAKTTERVSLGVGGNELDDHSGSPSISSDGRVIAFDTLAANGAPGQSTFQEAFVHDRKSGETTLISVDNGGATIGGFNPTVSGDGRYVAFEGFPEQAGPLGGNPPDIYLRDLAAATTTNVSGAAPGGSDNGALVYNPDLSGDGRYVVFTAGDDLTDDKTRCCFNTYRFDTETGATTLLSNGGPLDAYDAGKVTVSDDGAVTAFQALVKAKRGGPVQQVFARGPLPPG